MIPRFVDDLKIASASFDTEQNRIFFYIEHDENSIFTNQYELVLKEIEGTYYPTQINHGFCAFECFCGAKGDRIWKECEFLTDYVDEIYERIKEYPRVRLPLLFL